MELLGYGARACEVRRVLEATAVALLIAGACAASAQTNPSGNAADQAPSEAARRAALSPYRFILQNSNAPARKPAAAAPAKPAETSASAVAEPKRNTAPPVQQAVAPQAAPAPKPAAAEPAPAPTPAPEPSVATLSRKPAEPPPRREIIPVRTDEPHLPPALLREQPHGTVRVHFEVNPDGSVGEVKVVSSTNRSLNRPTVEAVRGWKFQPVDETLTIETEMVYKMDN